MRRISIRRIPIDAYALLAIAALLGFVHLPFLGNGMCFHDPAWYFHFGHRVADGAVPYRDFVFDVGPLPIYVDAAFQQLAGTTYVASLLAGLFIKLLRVWVIWMIVRRIAGTYPAVFVAVFCALDPYFAHLHHASAPYADLFVSVSGLCLVVASTAEGRRATGWLAAAGASAALVIAAQPSAALTVGATLLVASALLAWRRDWFTRRRFAALWIGFAAGIVLVFGALAVQGAAGDAIRQMVLDAPEKHAARGQLGMVLDAVSGGAMVDGGYTYLGGGLYFLGLPLAFVLGTLYLASRDKPISTTTIALLLVPGAICVRLLTRDAVFLSWADLPLLLLTATTALAVIAPSRLRGLLGIEPVVAIGVGALPLATNWAHEMSTPGRGRPDLAALVTGLVLIALATPHVARAVKTALCAGFAVAGIVHFLVFVYLDAHPFEPAQASDGALAELDTVPVLRGAPHPMLAGVRMPAWRAHALEWLAAQVPPGSTCFVYANQPVLYDLLGCTNPTRVDATSADFASAADARELADALAGQPPDYIIEHERLWMSPPISVDLGDDLERYDARNPHAARAIHHGLRAIIARYDSLGTVGDALGPERAKQAAERGDAINHLRVWRRVR